MLASTGMQFSRTTDHIPQSPTKGFKRSRVVSDIMLAEMVGLVERKNYSEVCVALDRLKSSEDMLPLDKLSILNNPALGQALDALTQQAKIDDSRLKAIETRRDEHVLAAFSTTPALGKVEEIKERFAEVKVSVLTEQKRHAAQLSRPISAPLLRKTAPAAPSRASRAVIEAKKNRQEAMRGVSPIFVRAIRTPEPHTKLACIKAANAEILHQFKLHKESPYSEYWTIEGRPFHGIGERVREILTATPKAELQTIAAQISRAYIQEEASENADVKARALRSFLSHKQGQLFDKIRGLNKDAQVGSAETPGSRLYGIMVELPEISVESGVVVVVKPKEVTESNNRYHMGSYLTKQEGEDVVILPNERPYFDEFSLVALSKRHTVMIDGEQYRPEADELEHFDKPSTVADWEYDKILIATWRRGREMMSANDRKSYIMSRFQGLEDDTVSAVRSGKSTLTRVEQGRLVHFLEARTENQEVSSELLLTRVQDVQAKTAELKDALRAAFQLELEQTPSVTALPHNPVYVLRQLTGYSDDDATTEEAAAILQLCRESKSQGVMFNPDIVSKEEWDYETDRVLPHAIETLCVSSEHGDKLAGLEYSSVFREELVAAMQTTFNDEEKADFVGMLKDVATNVARRGDVSLNRAKQNLLDIKAAMAPHAELSTEQDELLEVLNTLESIKQDRAAAAQYSQKRQVETRERRQAREEREARVSYVAQCLSEAPFSAKYKNYAMQLVGTLRETPQALAKQLGVRQYIAEELIESLNESDTFNQAQIPVTPNLRPDAKPIPKKRPPLSAQQPRVVERYLEDPFSIPLRNEVAKLLKQNTIPKEMKTRLKELQQWVRAK